MKLRLATALAVGCIAIALLALGSAYWAARRVPAFYQQVLQAGPAALKQNSDQLLENAAALASRVQNEERWQALFTAEQINGWLAVDVVKNFPELLPKGVADPRIAIHPDRVALACRYLDGPVETVLSLEGEVYLQEPNVLSVRILRARAGALPAPLGSLLQAISRAADDAGVQLRWLQAGGDPVAVVRLHPPGGEARQLHQIGTLELREGEIYLAGRTFRGAESGPLASAPDDAPKTR
jgi:hypothetical protein